MKSSKILASLLATTMLLGNSITTLAADITTTGDATTGTTPVSMSIAEQVVVTIPASLELIEDADGNYVASGEVSAYGNLKQNNVLRISTDTTAVCADGDVTVNGSVMFGTNGMEEWTAEQVGATTLDSRAIDVMVSNENVVYAGDYEATIEFDIDIIDLQEATDAALAANFKWDVYGSYKATVTGLATGVTETNLVIPSTYEQRTVTAIKGLAFFDNEDIVSVVISDSVSEIATSAFRGCTNLTNVTLPSGLSTLGDGAFADCTNLTNVTLPSGLTTLGNGAFADCTSLTSIMYNDVEYTSVSALISAMELNNVEFYIDAEDGIEAKDAFAGSGLSE